MIKGAMRMFEAPVENNKFLFFLDCIKVSLRNNESPLLTWRNWQTRTSQKRMGNSMEVRVLS